MPGAIEDEIAEIRGWLEHDGFTLTELGDPETDLTLEASRPDDFTYSLVHPDREADHVFVGMAFPGEALDEALGDATEEEIEVFLADLRFGLLGMGVEFEGLEVGTEQITLFIPAYFDGLSKDRFMEKLRTVKNAGLFLEWSLVPAEEAPTPPPEAGGDRYIR
jgi:hypothetical protein